MFILKVSAAVAVFIAIGIGFVLLNNYVKNTASPAEESASLELINPPDWLTEDLKEKIYTAAVAGGEDLRIDEDAALSVQQNLEAYAPWLDEIEVQTTHESLRICARWRKPIGLVEFGLLKVYVDSDLVVLDFVPMPKLPIVRVKGVPLTAQIPSAGSVWHRDDLASAVAILVRLDLMDKDVTPDKPLLYEIDNIDVSNFNGRQNNRLSHIILYTTDNTKIIWGAEIGTWQRHLESTDEQKLAKLYSHYQKYGSLLNNVKSINLRDPQDNILQPVDKY
ncbi:MAG: cell division protein FtsQ/DivIB [Planctomycetota bacterium]